MVQQLYDNYIFIYGMAGLCVLGTILKIVVSRTYKRLIKASDNMGSTKHKLMKLMKMKFEACYKLKIGVNNVDSFVDKYVYKHKVCGIFLYTWENIGGQLLILCLLAGTVGSVLGLAYNCGKNDILITFFTGVFTSSLLIVVESFINLGAKKSILKANITDYLENFLKVRLEQENFTPEVLEEYRKEYFSEALKENNKKEKKKEARKKVKSPVVVEEKYTKNQRMVEELKKEKEASQLAKQKEMEKKLQVEMEQKAMEEKEAKPVTEEMEIDKKESNISEDMRFSIKNFQDIAVTKEEVTVKQEKVISEKTIPEKTVVKEKVDSKSSAQRIAKTESEEKIIEDILKEFLA
ncbi:hypothetical protein [Anaerosporobacter sp.]|uniref:hypothetical protein n=1 Tax=Anaerosporobacter sp. TaxID=1872529 RepID=UPI00286EBBCE|nr:hypothetical protein [Anaerosporobacter sp.]